MQTELASRIEKIWSMAEIALKQGFVDYGTDGHSKIARISGMTFKFVNNTLVRIRGTRLDIAITHPAEADQGNVVFFPKAQTVLQFLTGDDSVLERCHQELMSLQQIFSVKRAA